MSLALSRDKMLFPNNAAPGSLAHAMRLQNTLSVMDESVRGYIYEQLREAEVELQIQLAATRQLDAELQAEIHRDHKNGTADSLLYQKLPLEIRAHIFSYVVAADRSVHVFPPKGNESHGYRLSLCDESSYDFELGHCRCDDSRVRGSVTSNFFDNAIFLVSQSVRREALDAFFLTNRFTFTCLYELVRFTSSFKSSSSKMQDVRIFERVDDYPNSDFRIKGIQKARQRLKALKSLELYVFLSSWSAYETLHEDGLVNQLLHFALGPPPASSQSTTSTKQGKKRKMSEALEETSEDKTDSKIARTEQNKETGTEAEKTELPAAAEEKTSSSTSDLDIPQTVSTSDCSDIQEMKHVEKMMNAEIDATSLMKDFNLPSPASDSFPEKTSDFSIPPLKSFKANVRLRNFQLSMRSRPDNAKAEYYAKLYSRLTDHLTDVFLDNGKRYRVIEDIPSLGPKPKLKVRDDERALSGAEKRGILYLKD